MRGWCKQGWHEVPMERLVKQRKPGHYVCDVCAQRSQAPTPVPTDLSKPHRVPRKTPDTPLRKDWKK